MQVKIIGAGSIGNHLAQASRRMGWEVTVTDVDKNALERMQYEIYPKRYGAWDDTIQLFRAGDEPLGCYDIIMVGTPPHVRMEVASAALLEEPRLLHLEKPLCTPLLYGLPEFEALLKNSSTLVTVGYNHAISPVVEKMRQLLMDDAIDEIITIDVEFREHWQGIFDAHPWLSGPSESYLGSWNMGGGAGGEHSHALHLWLCLATWAGWGHPLYGVAMFDMVGGKPKAREIMSSWGGKKSWDRMMKGRGEEYDRLASFMFKTEDAMIGRVIQDVVTYPSRKWARVQGANGWIEWEYNGYQGVPKGDVLRFSQENGDMVQEIFPHTRPDDFYDELVHYQKILAGEIDYDESPLSFAQGRKVMQILHDCYWSGQYRARPLLAWEVSRSSLI